MPESSVDQAAEVGRFGFRRNDAGQALPGITRALDDLDRIATQSYPSPSLEKTSLLQQIISIGCATSLEISELFVDPFCRKATGNSSVLAAP